MRKSKILYFPLLTLMVMGFFWAGVSIQADVVYLLNMPEKAEIHHGNIQLNVLFMNNGSMVEQCEIPNKMYVLVSQKNTIQKKVLQRYTEVHHILHSQLLMQIMILRTITMLSPSKVQFRLIFL